MEGPPQMPNPVLSIRSLNETIVGSGADIPAVRGIDLDVHENEVLGIVGESGSGKSVTALAAAGLLPRTARITGSVLLGGRQVVGATADDLRRMRGQDVGVVFQDRLAGSARGGRPLLYGIPVALRCIAFRNS